MKKLFFAIAFLSSQISFGQLNMGNYVVKVQTAQPYAPLSSATNLTSGLVWDEESFKIPLGFTINLDGKSTSSFSIVNGAIGGPASDTSGTINGFFCFAASDLIDRGAISGTPKSPQRYLTTGTTPNRIFKYEVFNAGFFDEGDIYGTQNDSVNFQIWVYETTNIVELRYGSSKITYPSDYFYAGSSPLVGMFKDFDLNTYTFTKSYSLTGSSTAPNVDSFTDLTSAPPVMSSYPANGTVYRFIPKAVATAIGENTIAHQFNVYPTVANQSIHVDYSQSATTKVDMYTASGQLVQSTSIDKGENTIDISSLANGNYLLNVSNTEGKASFKFVKY